MCINCGNKLSGMQKKFCSMSCRSKSTMTRLNKDPAFIAKARLNGRFGELWKDKEFRKDNIKRISERKIEHWKNPEYIQKMKDVFSSVQINKGMLGRIKGYYNSPKAGSVSYRSSYELNAYKILDSRKSVKSYKVEPVSIEYYDEVSKNIRQYHPDILIEHFDGSKELLEVKSEYFLQLDSQNNVCKFLAAIKYCKEKCMKFTLWTDSNWPVMEVV